MKPCIDPQTIDCLNVMVNLRGPRSQTPVSIGNNTYDLPFPSPHLLFSPHPTRSLSFFFLFTFLISIPFSLNFNFLHCFLLTFGTPPKKDVISCRSCVVVGCTLHTRLLVLPPASLHTDSPGSSVFLLTPPPLSHPRSFAKVYVFHFHF